MPDEELIVKSGRLDRYVVRQLPSLSRSAVEKIIDQGHVKVNGQAQRKAGAKVRPDDKIEIDFDAEKQLIVPEINLPIIYEDADCIVIDKPIGILAHSKGAFNPEATVATWLSARIKGLSGERAGIVHRLDRATSGVMICAKTPEAQSWLQKQFAQRKTKKTYLAIVGGELKPAEAIIDMPIERHRKRPQTFRVGKQGKAALTAYKVLAAQGKYSLIELKPTTGRTHQLRVHLQKLGHPIVGDTLYGRETASRLALHAWQLEITLPSRQRQVFTAPLPTDFKKLLPGVKFPS